MNEVTDVPEVVNVVTVEQIDGTENPADVFYLIVKMKVVVLIVSVQVRNLIDSVILNINL